MPFNYRLHGLTMASEFALPELINRQIQSPLSVDLTVQRGSIDPSDALDTQLPYLKRAAGGALFTLDDVGRFLVREGCEVSLDANDDVDDALLRLHLFGSVMGMVCHQRGLPVLHASAIAVDGLAVAFCGMPGAGKSTLAAHCVSLGAQLLADDVLVLSFEENSTVLGHPGMPNLKLWRDALSQLGRETTGLRPDWWRAEKFHVPADDVAGTAVPLIRLYVLGADETAGTGECKQLRGHRAANAVFANTYRSEYLEVAGRRNDHFHDCVRIASHIEIVSLLRARDPALLTATAAGIVRQLRSKKEII